LLNTLPKSSSTAPEEREQILLRYLPEVRYIARHIADRLPPHVPFDDLVQAGILGLIDAVDRFDATKNVELASYAKFRIRGAILDSLRKSDWGPRKLRRLLRRIEKTSRDLATEIGHWPTEAEVAEKLGMPLEEFQQVLGNMPGMALESLQTPLEGLDEDVIDTLSAKDDQTPFHLCLREELCGLVAQALKELGEKERQVLSMYYVEELTMKEVGAVMKLGESRVSQLHATALIRVRSHVHEATRSKAAESEKSPDGKEVSRGTSIESGRN
jgi:RNA polymerase sigma factor FliA